MTHANHHCVLAFTLLFYLSVSPTCLDFCCLWISVHPLPWPRFFPCLLPSSFQNYLCLHISDISQRVYFQEPPKHPCLTVMFCHPSLFFKHLFSSQLQQSLVYYTSLHSLFLLRAPQSWCSSCFLCAYIL